MVVFHVSFAFRSNVIDEPAMPMNELDTPFLELVLLKPSFLLFQAVKLSLYVDISRRNHARVKFL